MELSRAVLHAPPPARSPLPRLSTQPTARAGPVRRTVDIAVALVGLVLTAPLSIGGAVWVALVAGRPVFFGHRRVGLRGRTFSCWKLRTMHVDAERILESTPELLRVHRENGFKLPALQDPRIIPGGRWLRRSHVDELPQLFSLLVGDMTLVGPRPVVEEELALFGDDLDVLLSVRPGLFGAWTSRGRGRPPYPERARLEVEGVKKRGAIHDLGILLRSVGVVLRGQEEG